METAWRFRNIPDIRFSQRVLLTTNYCSDHPVWIELEDVDHGESCGSEIITLTPDEARQLAAHLIERAELVEAAEAY